MNEIVFTNNRDDNLKKIINHFSKKADCIKIATAFFSDTEFIIEWLRNSKNVELIVSLRPPTNYYSLKKIYAKNGIKTHFLGKEFHSKFYVFAKGKKPYACIIGSSNFTAGGLQQNIETNAILTDSKYIEELSFHFDKLKEQSFVLQPSDLSEYKIYYDNYRKRNNQDNKDQENLEKKILNKRTTWNKRKRIGKEAKQYFEYWRIVDEVKELVSDISLQEYPNVPVYLSIDHFWHWIKTVWGKENRSKPTLSNRMVVIPRLFQEYIDWDKKNVDFNTRKMAKKSKSIFGKLLSKNNIDKLNKNDARFVYSNLHSGGMRTRRFGSDKTFIKENSIQKIRKSLKYLLYSNDELDLRIHNLCTNPVYKLSQLSSSGVQEIIGWVNPYKYPIRNKKADTALKLIGYEINGG